MVNQSDWQTTESDSRADKKAILLEAAVRIYARQGDFTARELAAETGMNTAALNYYFGSKEALMILIEQQLLEVFITEIRLRGDSSLPVEERLYELLSAVNDRLRNNPGFARHFVEMLIEGQPRIYQLLDQAVGQTSPVYQVFAGILREAGIIEDEQIWHRLIIGISALAPTLVIGLGRNASAQETEILRQTDFIAGHIRTLAHLLLAE
ncbi:MAG: TetR/AcrR family transcriptional regulator, fatty acid metabolism regulator protein [Clostridiales bacterium]|jgi:AcrR family transcriptional regulator|nr:TetR/AcrR family transcriptional regulator, fatty acid metabolism regulator protein [Clostridiales bacterium]